VSEEKQDRLFSKYDADGSGFIDYTEFKQVSGLSQFYPVQWQHCACGILDHGLQLSTTFSCVGQVWLRCANVKKELTDRGVVPPKFATRGQLMRMLEKVLSGAN